MRTLHWVVIWCGKSTTVFLDANGQWCLEPDEAGLHTTPGLARAAIGNVVGTKVVPCWVFQ